MQIIAHRGWWLRREEQNALPAFVRAFENGFGIETDIRDQSGEIAISHDLPGQGAVPFNQLLELYAKRGDGLPLALNVKADGLYALLRSTLELFAIKHYFVFDMSIPETLKYRSNGFHFFVRQSEYEPAPALYDQASGVWLDEFREHWITETVIAKHLENKKKVCIVSPELHGRDYQREWANYKKMEEVLDCRHLMMCTDYPEEARGFFCD